MSLFIELSILIVIATLVAIVMRSLKQPLLIGHIATGIIVGPIVLSLITSTETLHLFSEIGVAILLFIVGLHLHPQTMKKFGKVSLITGFGQVIFTSLAGFLVCIALGFSTLVSVYVGIALAFSSTIIIMKLVADKGDIESLYGKISIGFLLVQDIIAILGLDELSEEDRVTVDRARKVERFLSQPMFVAEVFTGQPGVFTSIDDTVSSFEALVQGDLDHLPEQAFYMVGGAEEVERKAAELESNA